MTQRTPTGRRVLFWSGILCLPLSGTLWSIAHRFPQVVEAVYGQWLYPRIAWVLSELNGLVPFSLAELVSAAILIGLVTWPVGFVIFGRSKPKRTFGARLVRLAVRIWVTCGVMLLLFTGLWGFNYARPGLAARMGIEAGDVRAEEILAAGTRCAELAGRLHSALGVTDDEPTRLPMSFAELNEIVDGNYRRLALPGDSIRYPTSPAKKLFASHAVAYLGLSGVFVPFTGEALTNGLLPDCVIPIVVAHEKAHQRGVTHEGEANLAAFLACSASSSPPYLRYAAYLSASSRLLASSSRELAEETRHAWDLLGPGPLRDLAAVRDFWAAYEGRLSDTAEKVNDAYLRSMRVPEGIESYGQIVRFLVALDREGKLTGNAAPQP